MLLFLAACAAIPPAAPPPRTAAGPSILDGPDALTRGQAPAAVRVLDEASLAALLQNDGPDPLVVNFWATWCAPCVRELTAFGALAAERPDIRFALVNLDDRRDRARIAPFLAGLGVTLPSYHLDSSDPAVTLRRLVPGWPDAIPVTLVLEPGGAVRARYRGEVEASALRATLTP